MEMPSMKQLPLYSLHSSTTLNYPSLKCLLSALPLLLHPSALAQCQLDLFLFC
ncbi:unnamed protein product [Cylicostephanus goldi]|uniref:Uncharacterized protein n=1 Tax=Cylicostephanus goldi TaxID=71465 RepID=A0A3P7MFS2_CYLGO|nr:unnamed protein product [Cylicostephanus goldi]